MITVVERISTFCGWMAGAGVYAMVILIFIDVILRYFFASPLLFADEMSVYLMIYVAFIGAALTMKMGVHISVDILYRHFPKRSQLWLSSITTVLGTFICFLMTWQAAVWVKYTCDTGFISPGILETPMWIPMASIPVGLLLWSMQFLVEAIKAINLLRQYNSEPGSG
ncbi:MAG: TRAP transporter small permease [Deltaproteobacteria bacterium]|nr:TRAP transporter small permease [Deltaproteobacteria bacterium]